MELIDCSLDYLRDHLEVYFLPGMSWANCGRGGWHIDHIRPCADFDLTDPAQQRECFHWNNLQPMWEPENNRKGARPETEGEMVARTERYFTVS
jgi:hypothetical protein